MESDLFIHLFLQCKGSSTYKNQSNVITIRQNEGQKIISIDAEKEFDKIQHLFTIKKNSTNLEIEGNDIKITKFSSVQFSRSVVSDSLQPHESQHTRPPCPSPTPRVHSNSCPSSQWCHPAISSSVVPFSSCPQSLPVSESLPMSQLLVRGGQSTGVSALASFLPKNTQGWSL